MKRMAASEFKSCCLAVMDEVQRTREAVVITKRGKPVVTLITAETAAKGIIGRLEGVVRIVGDVQSPIEPPEAWKGSR